MLNLSSSEWLLVFFTYSVMGWLCETIWCSVGAKKLVNRGFLSGPWCPVYGFGGVIILLIATPFSHSPILVFLVSTLSTTLLEYFTGWLMEALFKTRWWDYSSRRFQIKGRVCLRNSLLFGLLGLAAVYLFQPAVADLLGLLGAEAQRGLASVIVVVFFFDLLHALAVTTNLEERLKGLRAALAELERYQESDSWYNAKDIPGSIRQLRELCAAEPDNEVAAGILARIDDEIERGGVSARLARAFPGMRPRALSPEFTALKEGWEERGRAGKHKANKALSSAKEKAAANREMARQSYKDISLTQLVWVFLMGSVIGYVVETLFCLATTGVLESRQGMLYGPFNQVYGFGAVMMVLLLSPLNHRGDGWMFLGGALVGGAFEAAVSLIQEAAFGSISWEYSGHPFSLFGGRTNLLFMCFWGILAVVYMKAIYPRMTKLIGRIPKRPKQFFTWAIGIILSANMLLSALAVGRWGGRIEGRPPQNSVQVWLDERYPDEMLEEIYPNMQFVDAGRADGMKEAGGHDE